MSVLSAWTHLLESPLGPLGAVFDDRGALVRLGFLSREEADWPCGESWNGDQNFRYLLRQLEAYFLGDCRTFNVPLRLAGSEPQRRVWRQLQDIPFGAVATVADLARELHLDPRTVAQAVAANPVAILVPCHRVQGEEVGSMDLERRRALLELEQGVLRRAGPVARVRAREASPAGSYLG